MKCSVLNLYLQTWKVNKKHSNEIDTKHRKPTHAHINPDPKAPLLKEEINKEKRSAGKKTRSCRRNCP